MGTPGGGPAGDFRKAGRQPAFRAPDRAGMQPEQDGFLIALPERLAEGGGLLQCRRGKRQLGPVLTRGFRRQDGLQSSSRSRPIRCSSESGGIRAGCSRAPRRGPRYSPRATARRSSGPAARNGGLDARRSRCASHLTHRLAKIRPVLSNADRRLFPAMRRLSYSWTAWMDGWPEQGGSQAPCKINLRTGNIRCPINGSVSTASPKKAVFHTAIRFIKRLLSARLPVPMQKKAPQFSSAAAPIPCPCPHRARKSPDKHPGFQWKIPLSARGQK